MTAMMATKKTTKGPQTPHRLLFILGTRPEVIKMAPVVIEARKRPEICAHILHTGQHRELAAEMFDHFGLSPDFNLDLMRPDQNLFDLSARIISGIGEILSHTQYDMIFVQGDTSTAFLGALCAFYRKIPVGHIEAGLRTNNRYSPYPEEINRRLIGPLASLHFAPTQLAQQMLLKEGIEKENAPITGNTVIDALHWSLKLDYQLSDDLAKIFNQNKRVLLVTTHRRENFGGPHQAVFEALLELVEAFEDLEVLFPIHPNPNVREQAARMLQNHGRIHLTAPLDYKNFILAMQKCHLILSDSGGIQEEAPSLKKPVLVLRESTERPEGLETGAIKLVGTDKGTIVKAASELLTDTQAYAAMTAKPNPYGDGKAAERIITRALSMLSTPIN